MFPFSEPADASGAHMSIIAATAACGAMVPRDIAKLCKRLAPEKMGKIEKSSVKFGVLQRGLRAWAGSAHWVAIYE